MKVSRRHCVGWLGAAVILPTSALVPSAQAAVQNAGVLAPGERAEPEIPANLSASALLAPLSIGSKIGTWKIEALGSLHAGAVSVRLCSEDGTSFHIDICAQDQGIGAPNPPSRTERCDLFVANEGSGDMPTEEEQGLAAMALAEIVRVNEHRVQLEGLLTLRERLQQHGDQVVRRCMV